VQFLKEFKTNPDRLSDLLEWACMIGPGLILNKDGSFQKTFRYRGPDLASAMESELVITASQLNNVFKRLSGGWCIYAEAQRIRSQAYPESTFPDPITMMIDEERNLTFGAGNHYENNFYLTLLHLPPPENVDRVKNMLIQRNDERKEDTYHTHQKNFTIEVERIYSLFKELMVQAEPLSDSETLTYLHNCVSPKRHFVNMPEIPMYLDAILADTPLIPGLEPKLGNYHLRTISILGFPSSSYPGILDALNWLNYEYRWVTRFLPLDKIDAQRELNQYRKKWFSKRKGAMQLIKEVAQNQESAMMDSDALAKSTDSDQALLEIGGDYVSYGYFTATVTVWDKDLEIVEKKVNAIETTINSLGFTTINETVNSVDAWLGSLPGLCRANIRRPLMNSLNLAHLFPFSAVWAGPEKNKHLQGPPINVCPTSPIWRFKRNGVLSGV